MRKNDPLPAASHWLLYAGLALATCNPGSAQERPKINGNPGKAVERAERDYMASLKSAERELIAAIRESAKATIAATNSAEERLELDTELDQVIDRIERGRILPTDETYATAVEEYRKARDKARAECAKEFQKQLEIVDKNWKDKQQALAIRDTRNAVLGSIDDKIPENAAEHVQALLKHRPEWCAEVPDLRTQLNCMTAAAKEQDVLAFREAVDSAVLLASPPPKDDKWTRPHADTLAVLQAIRRGDSDLRNLKINTKKRSGTRKGLPGVNY